MILTSNSFLRIIDAKGGDDIVARQKKEGAVKLTLFLNQEVIIKAKIYALENKRSLSDIVEELLKEKINGEQEK